MRTHSRPLTVRLAGQTLPHADSSACCLPNQTRSRLPTLDELHALANRPPTLTASIYLPIQRQGNGRSENRIRVCNLVGQAADLLARCTDSPTADTIINRLERVIMDAALWAHPTEGLALFATAGDALAFHLPIGTPELVTVGNHCQLKPLVQMLQGDGRFHLIELSQHGVRVHEGSRFILREIALPGAPRTIDDVGSQPSGEHRMDVRTIHAGTAAHYFSTPGDEQGKERIKHFFRLVDDSLCSLLHESQTPLVTAGVAYLLPLYWSVSRYPRLIQAGIDANPARPPTDTLHRHAWEVVAPHFAKTAIDARERLSQLWGTAQAAHELADILPALGSGRVADLFVAAGSERWGTFDEQHQAIREHEPRRAGDDDLLNLALIQAIRTHARVHVLTEGSLPGKADLAAIYRY